MAKRKKFDVVAAARGLYERAVARQDFSGAAAALRLLRDLPPEQPQAGDNDLDIDTLTLPEKKEQHDIVVAVKLLKNKVRARQGRELLPIPEPFKEPEPPRVLPPQWYPPQPEPRPKVEAPAAEAAPAVDPLDDYIAGEEGVEFGPPMEIKS